MPTHICTTATVVANCIVQPAVVALAEKVYLLVYVVKYLKSAP